MKKKTHGGARKGAGRPKTYIWIIIFLMLVIVGMIVFWPSPAPDTTQVYKDQIQKDRLIKQELEAKLNETLARIRTDSLQQAIQARNHTNTVDSLSARINDLKRNTRVITVLEENVEVRELVESQDSLITVQAARIDTLMVNLSDLRLDARKITANFEAQIEALGSIREAQTQIISQQEKEIRRHRREKRLAIIGGIVGVVGALLLGR